MKIVKVVLLLIVVVVVGVLGLAMTKPNTYHVERSATIAAPPAVVFAQIDDFHRWAVWSPWEKLDPAMKRTFGGPASGKDATYAWVGNDKVGEGRMTIVENEPDTRIGIKLEFIKPWSSTSQAGFALLPASDGTKVTWTMDGNYDFMSKVMCVFTSMDKMIGGDFEKGLAQLKAVSEATPPAAADTGAVAAPAN